MNLYFTDIFNVDPCALEEYGAFNISLINDLPLFIDPFLLFNSDCEDYQSLHHQILDYLRFLKDRADDGVVNDGLLRLWYSFPEVKQNWLGFSLVGNSGSGLGMDFAKALHLNLATILTDFGHERITKDSHLEKLCLIKDGVGRDNISDFTTNLIKDYLLQYTQDFAQQHLIPSLRKRVPVPRTRFNYATRSWVTVSYDLPWYNGDYVLLTPKDILTKDETWINKGDLIKDFDEVVVSLPDDALRSQVNEYLRRALPRNPKPRDVTLAKASAVLRYPPLIDYYICHKERHGAQAVSLSKQNVRQVEDLFIRQLSDFTEQLHAETAFYATGKDTYEETMARVLFLKDIIENKGGHRLFFVGKEPIRRETDLHILFRLTWFATPSDVGREVNDGRGPVDFKISRGSRDKALVEFKLAKNSQLKRNLEKQTDIYKKASDASRALRVIVYFTDTELSRVKGILRDLDILGHPDVILIDARPNKPSGSKA
jgi:hypothetical protein